VLPRSTKETEKKGTPQKKKIHGERGTKKEKKEEKKNKKKHHNRKKPKNKKLRETPGFEKNTTLNNNLLGGNTFFLKKGTPCEKPPLNPPRKWGWSLRQLKGKQNHA